MSGSGTSAGAVLGVASTSTMQVPTSVQPASSVGATTSVVQPLLDPTITSTATAVSAGMVVSSAVITGGSGSSQGGSPGVSSMSTHNQLQVPTSVQQASLVGATMSVAQPSSHASSSQPIASAFGGGVVVPSSLSTTLVTASGLGTATSSLPSVPPAGVALVSQTAGSSHPPLNLDQSTILHLLDQVRQAQQGQLLNVGQHQKDGSQTSPAQMIVVSKHGFHCREYLLKDINLGHLWNLSDSELSEFAAMNSFLLVALCTTRLDMELVTRDYMEEQGARFKPTCQDCYLSPSIFLKNCIHQTTCANCLIGKTCCPACKKGFGPLDIVKADIPVREVDKHLIIDVPGKRDLYEVQNNGVLFRSEADARNVIDGKVDLLHHDALNGVMTINQFPFDPEMDQQVTGRVLKQIAKIRSPPGCLECGSIEWRIVMQQCAHSAYCLLCVIRNQAKCCECGAALLQSGFTPIEHTVNM